ncbi:MAG: fused MFS/spermidine synthase [Gammaproteobacteria bacterium]|nr:fused MFS/spermidine synthase [Gammaproteobacteria bacterium]MBU1623589.1 fused MFS/spermidine synthase [Gammaproteobacteria bacterium]
MQGAMRVDSPFDLAFEYTRVMMAALLLREGEFPKKVLLIGLGAGSQAKYLYKHRPEAHLTVVEIEPKVVTAAKESFCLPDDAARLEVVVGDGVAFVHQTEQHFDLIMVDGFNDHSHPGDLNTLPFYKACRERLTDQGILAVNLIGLSDGVKGGFAFIESAFEQRAVRFPRCASGNTIAFAAAGAAIDIPLEALRERAAKEDAGLALSLMLDRLATLPVCEDGRLRI